MALWGKPNELSIQHHVYIYMQYYVERFSDSKFKSLSGSSKASIFFIFKNLDSLFPKIPQILGDSINYILYKNIWDYYVVWGYFIYQSNPIAS